MIIVILTIASIISFFIYLDHPGYPDAMLDSLYADLRSRGLEFWKIGLGGIGMCLDNVTY